MWKGGTFMGIDILSVSRNSAAARSGILPGEVLLRMNGEEVLDEIDYQALSMTSRIKIDLIGLDGKEKTVLLHKPSDAPLGLQLDERQLLSPRVCKNHCIFCFVDQMPQNLRPSLYVKDDDWRLSLMMGNFVTLTNVDENEFERILRRRVSPLYISVHATDPEVRVRMLRNPSAGNIMDRMRRLKDAGIEFHCQAVVCPGINDGAVLHQTIVDLAGLWPAARSLAVVPVGLTAHRGGLFPLRLFDRKEADDLLRDIELIQAYYQGTIGTRFVFPADELYSMAGRQVPSEDAYEGYPQIENGIGMLRQLADECEGSFPSILEEEREKPAPLPRHVLIPTGVSALRYIRELAEKYARPEDCVEVFAVPNHFFGSTVTVTGLIVGRDLADALKGRAADQVLISGTMLREGEDCFLDDLTVTDVAEETGLSLRVVQNNGEDFIRALRAV